MASEQDLLRALNAAKKGGDLEAMRRIAQRLESMEQAAPAPAPVAAQQESPLNLFSQGAISGGAALGDFLLKPVPGMEGHPLSGSLGSMPSLLQGAENIGITQPGALQRTDPFSVGGRAASGMLLGGPIGILRGGGARALGLELGAAGGSAAGEMVGREVGGDTGALVGAIAGGFFMPAPRAPSEEALARTTRENSQRAALRELFESGDEAGLRVQLADVNPAMRRMQSWLEMLPLSGGARRRANRLGEASSVAEELAASAQRRLAELDWDDLKKVRRAARGDGDRAVEAKRLLATIAAHTEDDLDRIIGVSQRLDLFKSKLASDELYARAERFAGTAQKSPTNAETIAARAAERLARGAGANQVAVEAMTNLAGELTQSMTIGGMRISRSNILELARESTNLRTKAAFESIADALHKDMSDVALLAGPPGRGRPGAFGAIQKANKHYRSEVIKRRNSNLSRAIDKTDLNGQEGQRFISDVVKQYLNPLRVEQAMFTWSQLGSKGRAAVQARIFRDAFEAASLRGNPGTAVFSPRKFGDVLRDYGPFAAQIGQTRIQGLSKLFRAISRDSAPGAAPFTGGRGADQAPLVGMGLLAMKTPGGAAALWATGRGLQAVMESQAGRGWITRAARTSNRRELLQISARLTAIAGRQPEE